MTSKGVFESMPLREFTAIVKALEGAGVDLLLIEELKRRPYLLTPGIGRIKLLVEEDKYHEPMNFVFDVTGGWQTIGRLRHRDIVFDAKVREKLPNNSYRLMVHISSPSGRLAKALEVVVTPGSWAHIGYDVEISLSHTRNFVIRYPREEPLYAPKLAASTQ